MVRVGPKWGREGNFLALGMIAMNDCNLFFATPYENKPEKVEHLRELLVEAIKRFGNE